jgi:hypothetical protein
MGDSELGGRAGQGRNAEDPEPLGRWAGDVVPEQRALVVRQVVGQSVQVASAATVDGPAQAELPAAGEDERPPAGQALDGE